MPDDSNVTRFFAEVQETMKLKFRGWERDIRHPGEKGGIRERRVADFLASILPKKYGIGTGHIIDSQEEPVISHQTDIVIYNALDGIVLPIDDHYSLFPCECVYAAIEVKSKLSASKGESGPSGSIYECVERTTRLKSLDRKRHNLPPIHSIVFAYAADWSEDQALSVKQWFETFGKECSKKLPEVVFVLDPGFVLTTSGPSGYNEEGKLPILYPEASLLFFVSDLIHRLSETKVATPNLWHDYTRWYPGDLMAKVWKKSTWEDVYFLKLTRIKLTK
jgi:hypothetical protein